MNELLKFITEHLSFLWAGGRFRIDEGFGNLGDAMVSVSSELIRVEIVRDRGQFQVTVRPTSATPSDEFALQAIDRLLTGEQCELLSCLDPVRGAVFLEHNIGAIENAFSPQQWSRSRPLLMQYRDEEQSRMFGGSRPAD